MVRAKEARLNKYRIYWQKNEFLSHEKNHKHTQQGMNENKLKNGGVTRNILMNGVNR